MFRIAAQLNQPETVFLRKRQDSGYNIRWFAPTGELVPGGNGTLAAGYLLLTELQEKGPVTLHNSQLDTTVELHDDGTLTAILPSVLPREISRRYVVDEALGQSPPQLLEGKRDLIAVFDYESEVRQLKPDFKKLTALDWPGVIVTARGDFGGFVYRTFLPALGLLECPGSAGALINLVPFWHYRTGEERLVISQLSSRGGGGSARFLGDSIEVTCSARLFGKAQFDVESGYDEYRPADQFSISSWI